MLLDVHVQGDVRTTGGIWLPRYRRIEISRSASPPRSPIRRTEATDDRFGDDVGGVIGTDEARGEARQIVGVLPVQLVVGNIHLHKMPQNPTLGDIRSRIRPLSWASDFVLDPT